MKETSPVVVICVPACVVFLRNKTIIKKKKKKITLNSWSAQADVDARQKGLLVSQRGCSC